MLRVFGLGPDAGPLTIEQVGRMIDPDDRASHLERVHSGVMPRSYDFEHRLTRQDGEIIWISEKIELEHDASGTPIRMLGAVQDVTERRRIEEALRMSEAQLNAILHGITANIAYVDKGLHILWANRTAAESVNMAPEEMRGHTCHELWADASRPCDHCPSLRAISTGRPELTIMHTPDGRVWDERGEPVFDHNGKLLGIVEIAQDITERTRAEEKIIEREQYLRTILQTTADGFLMVDMKGNVSDVNDTYCRMLGYSREEMLEMVIRDIDAMMTPEEQTATVQRVIAEGSGISETRHRRKDGTFIDVELSMTYQDANGGDLICFCRDITERKRAQAALEEANRKLNLLSSITRHDITNHLLVLQGQLALMEKERPMTSPASPLGKVVAAAQRISEMIQFTKEYENIGMRTPIWVSPGRQVAEAIILLHQEGVTLDDETDGIEVLADPLAEKASFNLVDNSMRHGEHVGHIRITAEKVGEAMLIIYEDDGIGIVDGDRDRLFERGFGKHTGLGLFYIKEILAITGITISEKGTAGQGARFEIIVPPGAWRAGCSNAK